MRVFPQFKALFGSATPLSAAKPGPPEGTGVQRQALVTEGVDAADGIGTAYTMAVDDTFDGALSGGDVDWIAVTLEAGQSYVVQAWGRDGSNDGLNDPVLRIHDSTGVQVALNDDVVPGSNTFSLIEYTAPSSGTYYVAVTGFNGEAGRYTVQVADDVFTPDQVASYLTDFDWGYAAPLRIDATVGDTITVNLTGLTADGRQLARWALESWEIALGITFVETTSAGANIVFDDNQPGAFAGPEVFSTVTGIVNQASVNIGTEWLARYGTTIDSYSFETYLHEIGHALGLGHAGPYDGFATYGISNVYLNDSTQITVMSYFDAQANTYLPGDSVSIISPMLADLIAVHELYGTPQAYAGDTTWGANSNVGGWLGQVLGEIFDGVDTAIYDGGPVGFTLYDTGGTDTVDLSTVSVAQRIDLRPESVSDIGGFEGNVVIARGTVLENVIGGSAADHITGNAADNRIEGAQGNDTINGAGGSDTAIMSTSLADTAVIQDGDEFIVISEQGVDIYRNVEVFAFDEGLFSGAQAIADKGPVSEVPTSGDDSLTGTTGADQFDGGDGNDTIFGGDGPDGLKGSDGNDVLVGGNGDDRLPGASGDDTIVGGDGDDRLGGGFGDDSMVGGDGNDGGGAGPGNDTVDAGPGDDIFNGGFGRDHMDLGTGNDRAGASFGNDTIYGGSGDDLLTGGDGNDLIFGEAGDDTINSGLGSDTVEGGAGADQFVFNALFGGGTTVITDFEDGIDTIRTVGLRNPPDPLGRLDIQDTVYEGDAAATFTYGDHTVIVQGVSAADLTEDDFLFV